MDARGYFIAGTDTGIGKTHVSCGLLKALNGAGRRALGMKPVATGAECRDGRLISDDVARISASSLRLPSGPALATYLFEPAVSPDIAAESAGICIETGAIVANYRRLASQADVVVVEGTGGWLCPIGPTSTMADIAVALAVPVLLVVGLRLGCLNHALLSLESIRARGCDFAGWIGNRIDPHYLLPEANLASLTRRLGMPPLAVLAHSPGAPASRVAAQLRELAARL